MSGWNRELPVPRAKNFHVLNVSLALTAGDRVVQDRYNAQKHQLKQEENVSTVKRGSRKSEPGLLQIL